MEKGFPIVQIEQGGFMSYQKIALALLFAVVAYIAICFVISRLFPSSPIKHDEDE